MVQNKNTFFKNRKSQKCPKKSIIETMGYLVGNSQILFFGTGPWPPVRSYLQEWGHGPGHPWTPWTPAPFPGDDEKSWEDGGFRNFGLSLYRMGPPVDSVNRCLISVANKMVDISRTSYCLSYFMVYKPTFTYLWGPIL